MTINSAIMLELARQRHLDVAHGVANAKRPAPARDASISNRRPVYRTRLAMVTAVVVGTLMWAAFVTGLVGLTSAKADAATGTELTTTAYQAQSASVTMTRPLGASKSRLAGTSSPRPRGTSSPRPRGTSSPRRTATSVEVRRRGHDLGRGRVSACPPVVAVSMNNSASHPAGVTIRWPRR